MNGENVPTVGNTVEAPKTENKPLDTSNDKEYTPDSKTLLELIVAFVEWVKKVVF